MNATEATTLQNTQALIQRISEKRERAKDRFSQLKSSEIFTPRLNRLAAALNEMSEDFEVPTGLPRAVERQSKVPA